MVKRLKILVLLSMVLSLFILYSPQRSVKASDYWDQFYACIEIGASIRHCGSNQQCAFQVQDEFYDCLDDLPAPPVYNPETCQAAVYASYECDAQFGPGGFYDWSMWSACRAATGVDNCQ